MPAPPREVPARCLVYERRSTMPVSAAELFAWHLRPGAFERLVPPGDGTRIAHRSGRLEDNTFRVELSVPVAGPIRQTWKIRHEGFVPDTCFADVMERGPFPYWRHEHRAVPGDEHSSELFDHIDYALPLGPLGRVAGRPIVERRLNPMFDHRHAVTANDLAAHADAGLAPLRMHLTGSDGSPAAVQLAAFLLTGGHEVAGEIHIAAYDAPSFDIPDVLLEFAPTHVVVSGSGDESHTVPLTGDVVADPRAVLAAIASSARD